MRIYQIVSALFVLSFLLGSVACVPGGQQSPVAGAGNGLGPAVTVSAGEGISVPVSGTLAAPLPTGAGAIVAATPLSEAELAAEPPGQTEGGAATDAGETDATEEQAELPPAADWLIYTDGTFGFQVAHPPGFVVQPADEARLAELIPMPSAAVYFMASETAASALAGTDAPDLEVRVFETGPVASLVDWLASVGVGADQRQTPTQIGELPAIEICVTTMLVPRCSTFVAAADHVYQLRMLNLEGEAMAGSFAP